MHKSKMLMEISKRTTQRSKTTQIKSQNYGIQAHPAQAEVPHNNTNKNTMLSSIAVLSAISLVKAPEKIKVDTPSKVVACYNQKTGEISKSLNESSTGCHKWNNFSNLRMPSSKQMDLAKKMFKTKENLAIFLAIWNHESQFDSGARGKNKWWWDCWILQIRDINWGCKMSDKQQMEWLKKVLEERRSKAGRCRSYFTEQWRWMTRCIFNRHNGQTKTVNGYSTRLLKYYDFYLSKLK